MPNSYAGFGNPGAGGLQPGRMRPPDFRSLLQSGNEASSPSAAAVGQPSTSGNDVPSLSSHTEIASGPTLRPLEPQAQIPESIGGVAEQAGVGGGAGRGLSTEGRLRPPDFRSILQSGNEVSSPSAPAVGQPSTSGNHIPTLSSHNDFASGPTLRPLEPQAEIPESIGSVAEQASVGAGAGGGLSRERRMRPPDFRSILQSDNEASSPSAPAVNQPFASGNDGNGGLVLKPLDSLNNGGNGFGNGFGANANAGFALKPPDFRMQADSNAGASIPTLPSHNDFASGPTLRPLEPQAEIPESIGGVAEQASVGAGAGGGLSRERRMRPPDFRSILQSDNEASSPSAPAVNQPFASGNDGNGGLVLKPLDSLNNGGNGFGNGFGANANAGFALKPPDFRMQADSNAGASIPTLPSHNDFASGPTLRPLEPQAEIPESIGSVAEQASVGAGAGGGLSRERRMRPPDFRSILQSDNEASSPSAPAVNQPFASGNDGNGGLVLKPLDSLNNGGNGFGNGFGANANAGFAVKPPDFRMQPDSNAGASIPTLSSHNDLAGGPALRPLEPQAALPGSIGGVGSDFAPAGAGRSQISSRKRMATSYPRAAEAVAALEG
eukprot:Skav206632  [mRNA]  locus=scaffold2313:141608:143811:- [translate_table: standard]